MTTGHVDIIIPVYRNLALSQRCLDSVLKAADPAVGTIYLINDASPEPQLSAYCETVANQRGISLITHRQNRGFVCSVNEGLDAASGRDVVILNSDTEVCPGWVTRLRAAAERHPRTASITPFSNNATICSYPNFCEDNDLPEGLNLSALDALFADANSNQVVELPTGVGFCMYLSRAALEDVGVFDEGAFGRGYGEENDWCLRATEKGWKHLLCADLFVYHAGGASFGDEASSYQTNALKVISKRYPDYESEIAAFIEADPIEAARYKVDVVRPDAGAVIDEYRLRERSLRAARYELDRQRHNQIMDLDGLLQSTREEAASRAERYEALLKSQREDTAANEVEYQKKLDEMAEGYAALERELQTLQRFWPVRLRNWLLRRLGTK